MKYNFQEMYPEFLNKPSEFIFRCDDLIPPMDERFIEIHGKNPKILTRRNLLNMGFDLQANYGTK